MIGDHERGMFVTLAKLEEEKSYYQQVKGYYHERVQTGKEDAPLPDMRALFEKLALPKNEIRVKDQVPLQKGESSGEANQSTFQQTLIDST